MADRAPSAPFYLNVWYTGDPAGRRPLPSNTFVRARGLSLQRQDGVVLEDWSGQYFVNNIGAGRARVAAALAAQARRLSWVSPADYAAPRLALTRALLEVLPPRLNTPQYTVGGSDAIETAVRAARKITGRTRVLTFTESYHGDTMTVENLCGGPLTPYGDRRPWAVKTPSPYALWRRGQDWPSASLEALDRLETTLRRRGPRTFAAVIVEPVLGTGGCAPLLPALARGLRAVCDRHGIKLIADEVITGFGRTGRWFGSETVGLRPDALVVAKGLTGGYAPLGAAIFERSWGERLRNEGLNHGLTFAGHPLGCAAALATIDILRSERLVARAATAGSRLRRALEEVRAAHPEIVREARGAGMFQALHFRGRAGRAAERAASVVAALRRDGVHVVVNTDGEALLFCPPFIVSDAAIDRLGRLLRGAVAGLPA